MNKKTIVAFFLLLFPVFSTGCLYAGFRDDFNGEGVDPNVWLEHLDSIEVYRIQNGLLEMDSGSAVNGKMWLSSLKEFIPSPEHPVTVSGRVQVSLSLGNSIQFCTRAKHTRGWAGFRSQGIMGRFWPGGNVMQVGRFNNTDEWEFPVVGSLPNPVSLDEWLFFEITDDGNTFAFTLTSESNPTNTRILVSEYIDVYDYNHVGIDVYGNTIWRCDWIEVSGEETLVPQPPATLFEDDFESGLGWWITNWTLSASQSYSGIYSVCADENSLDLLSSHLDITGRMRATVTFKYYIVGIDVDDEVSIQYYNGSDYIEIDEIGSDQENTWLSFSHTVYNTGVQATFFNEDFHIKIDTHGIDTNEYLYIDDLAITVSSDSVRLAPGDADRNCDIDLEDLCVLADQFLQSPILQGNSADFNNDYSVDLIDYAVLSENWHTERFGAEANPTGEPIGGDYGYSRLVDQYDYFVSNKTELLNALSQATSGQVIYVADNSDIDLTGEVAIVIPVDTAVAAIIPAGVTLAGGRSKPGSQGALIHYDDFDSVIMFLTDGPGIRITGLRLRGPDPEIRDSSYGLPNSRGIQSAYDIEIDNCEISAWSNAGVYVDGSSVPHIHHNYIHHCRRTGLGYGVYVRYASPLIEANLFDFCRHCIAGSGYSGCNYEARYNLVLDNATSHNFDMHGGWDRGDGTDIAGGWMRIHHNTFCKSKIELQSAIAIRGVPYIGAEIHHNWFLYRNLDSSIWNWAYDSLVNIEVFDNLCGPDRIQIPARYVDPNLVAYWKFDGASEVIIARDSSPNSYEGTLMNGPVWHYNDGLLRGALELDGHDDYVEVTSFNLTTNNITLIACIDGWKSDDWAGIVFSRGGNVCGMHFGDNNTLHYTWGNDSQTYGWDGGPEIPNVPGEWVMTAVVVEPEKATAYVYSDSYGLQYETNNILHNTQTLDALKLGWDNLDSSRLLNGLIEEVRIYSRALSVEEIQAMIN